MNYSIVPVLAILGIGLLNYRRGSKNGIKIKIIFSVLENYTGHVTHEQIVEVPHYIWLYLYRIAGETNQQGTIVLEAQADRTEHHPYEGHIDPINVYYFRGRFKLVLPIPLFQDWAMEELWPNYESELLDHLPDALILIDARIPLDQFSMTKTDPLELWESQ